jgi:hypothetical protein
LGALEVELWTEPGRVHVCGVLDEMRRRIASSSEEI